jgi:hypothetical protein
MTMEAHVFDVGVATGSRRTVATQARHRRLEEQGLDRDAVGTALEREAQWRTTRRFC